MTQNEDFAGSPAVVNRFETRQPLCIKNVGSDAVSMDRVTLSFEDGNLEELFKGYHSRKNVDSTVMKYTFFTSVVYCVFQLAWWLIWDSGEEHQAKNDNRTVSRGWRRSSYQQIN
jgi:hypothetical protein